MTVKGNNACWGYTYSGLRMGKQLHAYRLRDPSLEAFATGAGKASANRSRSVHGVSLIPRLFRTKTTDLPPHQNQ